jgi:hypothetical protein
MFFPVIWNSDISHNWKSEPAEKYTFREHERRGCWRDDNWVTW